MDFNFIADPSKPNETVKFYLQNLQNFTADGRTHVAPRRPAQATPTSATPEWAAWVSGSLAGIGASSTW